MAIRKPFVGGNWKMCLDSAEAAALTAALTDGLGDSKKVDVAICPSFVYLAQIGKQLCEAGSSIKLGAQDLYFQPNGAFTGEVSCDMLKDVGTKVVLAGHSERRHVIGECDTLINAKVLAALEAGFEVILCVGEKIEQREAGQTDSINAAQTWYGLAGVKKEQMANVTIAYEPVWAIGTGKTATAGDAQNAHAAIRKNLTEMYGEQIAQATRIQYGGSVKPDNAVELFSQEDIDGGLIGGAALKAKDFLAIIAAAAS